MVQESRQQIVSEKSLCNSIMLSSKLLSHFLLTSVPRLGKYTKFHFKKATVNAYHLHVYIIVPVNIIEAKWHIVTQKNKDYFIENYSQGAKGRCMQNTRH